MMIMFRFYIAGKSSTRDWIPAEEERNAKKGGFEFEFELGFSRLGVLYKTKVENMLFHDYLLVITGYTQYSPIKDHGRKDGGRGLCSGQDINLRGYV